MAHEATRVTYEASTHTRVLVAFFTDARNGLSITDPVQSHRDFGTVVGFSSNKGFGSASGTWSLTFKKTPTLAARSALRDLWSDPEDVWVKIKVQVDGQVIDTVRGMIDSISEATERVEMGKRVEVYTITGRDVGKILETTELWVNLLGQPNDGMRSQSALTRAWVDNLNGTPAHFVRILLEEWVGNSGAAAAQWMLPPGLGGGSFYEELLGSDGRVRGIDNMTDLVNGRTLAPQLFSVDQTGGKLWDSLQEYSNGVMNEFWIDLAPQTAFSARALGANVLRDMVPKVYLRERPFPTRSDDRRSTSRSKWNSLPTHTLEIGDVRHRAIAKGGAATRFNYWLFQPEGLGADGYGVANILQQGIDGVEYGRPGNIPIWNNDSIAKHGVRRYLLNTRYIPLASADSTELYNFVRLCASWLKKVHDWYAPAPMQLSGTLETNRIFPEIRIGSRVKERRAEGVITYYVENVAHAYAFPGSGKTTLTVTRGEYDDEDLLAQVYATYDRPGAGTAAELCITGTSADGETQSATDELIGNLAAGRAYCAPTQAQVEGFTHRQDRLGETEGADFTVAGGGTLEVERDGNDDGLNPDPDSPVTTLDDTDPAVGDSSQIPSGNATSTDPGAPMLDQGRLDRGQDINIPEGNDTDPIEGLTGAGP
jgi:hypothetical protein